MENIDFLPERIKARRARKARLTRAAYLLATCMAAMALLGYTRQCRIAKADRELGLLSERCSNVQLQLATLKFLQDQQAELAIKKRIDEELGSRADALDVLAELERVMPESIAVSTLNLEAVVVRMPVSPPGLGGTGQRAAAAPKTPQAKERLAKRVKFELVGLAPTDVDVANFIGQLSASPLFEDVSMGYTRNTRLEDRSSREFKVMCFVAR